MSAHLVLPLVETAVPGTEVELPTSAEQQQPAEVLAGEMDERQHLASGRQIGLVRIRGRAAKLKQMGVLVGPGEVDVEQPVPRVARTERQRQQARLVSRRDLR